MKTVIEHAETKMTKTIRVLQEEFAEIRAGRANPKVLDKITVDYYGAATPINQLAAIAVSEARVLTIQPWDASTCSLIEKAIQKSDLGINPQSDGKTIRLIFPQLTEERRREIAKDIGKMSEQAKVAVRNCRREAIDKLKKMKKESVITEDDLKDAEKDMQHITDKYCKEIETLAEKKDKEIMEI